MKADDGKGEDYRLETDERMAADVQPEADYQAAADSRWRQLITGFVHPSEEQKKLNKILTIIALLQAAGVMTGIPTFISISALFILSASRALGEEISRW